VTDRDRVKASMASTRLAASGVASPQPAARAHPPGPGTPLRFSRPWSRGTTEQQSPPRSLHLGNRSRRHHGVRHAAEFGDAFARACARRIDALEEDILEIADQTEDDYRETLTGRMVPNKELVLRSKVRIESRQWLMARRDPQQWGDKQSLDVSANIMLLTPEERVQKALQLFDLMEKFVEKMRKPVGGGPLVYDPGDDALPLLEVPRNRGFGQK
jgi:hypothetical protein